MHTAEFNNAVGKCLIIRIVEVAAGVFARVLSGERTSYAERSPGMVAQQT